MASYNTGSSTITYKNRSNSYNLLVSRDSMKELFKQQAMKESKQCCVRGLQQCVPLENPWPDL